MHTKYSRRVRDILAVCGIALSTFALAGEPAPGFESMPKIDVHVHISADIPEFAAMLERTGFRVVNICGGSSKPETMAERWGIAKDLSAAYPKVYRLCPTFDLTRRNEPGYADAVIDSLDQAFDNGAVTVKIFKEVGLDLKRPDGAFLMPDDALFDPIYTHMAEKGRSMITHFAEPLAAWLPLDPENVHYSYYSKSPKWHFYTQEGIPAHEDVIAARSRVLEKHPNLVMIGAHLGSLEHDVKVLGDYLEKYPNFYVDSAARTGDLSRQAPEAVRAFFIKYQDRVIYGSDIGVSPPENAEEAAKVTASAEAHYRMDWQYFSGTGPVTIKNKEVDSLNLPREVLEKFYYRNAERVMPGLRRK